MRKKIENERSFFSFPPFRNGIKKKLLLLLLAFLLGGAAAFFSKIWGREASPALPEFPQPQLIRSYIPPSEVPASRITVPIRLAMEDLESLANRNLPRQYRGDVEYLEGTVRGKLSYTLRREEDVKVAAKNGKIQISLPVRFQVRFAGSVLAAIVRVPFSAQTEGALRLFITIRPEVRRDWSVKTDAEVDFKWEKSPRLNVAGIPIGLQRESDKFLREAIRDNLYKLDDGLNRELRLRERMQREWDNLTVPVRAAESVFLHFDPRGVAASPLEVAPDEVTLRASVETGISLSVGLGEVVPARKKNLPPLEPFVSGDETILLNVRTLLNYDSLEREAMSALSGSKIDMGITSVSVRSLRLAGSGEKLAAAFEIQAGSSRGTIYAAGEPSFDGETRTLAIKNFELDEGTRDGLLKTAAWLLRPALVKFLNEKLEWKLGPALDRLADEARAAIASYNLGGEFELRGTLESAEMGGLRVTGQGIEVGLNLKGAASLTYIPLF